MKDFFHRFESFWRRLIASKWNLLLAPLVLLFGLCVKIRSALYSWQILPSHQAAIPVISVGNLTMGGTGKTPFVQMVAADLAKRRRVAILSRGYRAPLENQGPVLVSRGSGPLLPARLIGDEPFLLASSLTGVMGIVGRDRVGGAALAASLGAEIAILDDGLQHRRLRRSEEVILIDGRQRLKELHLFPRGTLREGLSAFERATLLVVTGADESSEGEWTRILRRYSEAPIIGVRTKSVGVFDQEGSIQLEGKRVALFCGIANPERFRESVSLAGATIVKELFLDDHGVPTSEQLQDLAQGVDLLLCTEKDWVKLPDSGEFKIAYLKVSHELIWGELEYYYFINRN